MKKPEWLSVPILLLGIAVSGCSAGAGPEQVNPNSPDAIIVTDFAQRQLVFDTPPQHIVALGNGETDIIYALGGTLVGRPTSDIVPSNPAALDVSQVGSTHEVDLERISLLKPDVVLGNHPMNTKDIPTIESLGSQMLLSSANSIADIQQQITLLGELIDRDQQAEVWVKKINEAVDTYQQRSANHQPRVLLVYGAPGTFMAALPNSLSGDILSVAGGINIASDYPRLQSYPQYAQLSSERIVEANPERIFILTHGKPDEVRDSFVREMQTNPAWNKIDAVTDDRIEVLPPDLFGTNPGTRILDALALMHDKLGLATP
ncbi:ABC transporter substrate-binding protein [Paenibacillus daejeonensis]|uniref:ABC transporter substrate-binding protein n=1 Tax=Paenibacillus daejeonensis TaxID=135193 RepID=UPI000376E0AE|nr:ABC transporter substrate-binding protein [Paenibacillus daejeonensis]